MKITFTFIFGILISTTAMASVSKDQLKVEINGKKIEWNNSVNEKNNSTLEVARIHKFRNSRVKKELKFTTKASKVKMA